MSMLAGQIGRALSLARTNRTRKSADIRNHVLLQPADANNFYVVCSDDTTETQVKVSGVLNSGMAIASEFCDLVQTLAEDVQIKMTDSGKSSVKIQTGKSRFTMPTAAAQDFPRFQAEDSKVTTTIEVDPAVFGKALSLVKCGMGKPDPSKPFTHGILLSVRKDALFMVGSNGQKMTVAAITAKISEGQENSGVLPEMAITQLERLTATSGAEPVLLSLILGERQLVASMGNAVVKTRLVACQYPDWGKVTTTKVDGTIEVSRSALLHVIKRVGLFVSDKSPAVSLVAAEGKLQVSCKTEQGECTESLEIGTSQSLSANVNITFLAALLESMPIDKVSMDFGAILRVRAASGSINSLAIAALYRV